MTASLPSMAGWTVCGMAAPWSPPWRGPQNLAGYGVADAADLAAAYAYGIARNHGFADGNKRTAWVVARLFLADNGYRLRFDPSEAVAVMEAVAAGTLAETDLAAWFRRGLAAREG